MGLCKTGPNFSRIRHFFLISENTGNIGRSCITIKYCILQLAIIKMNKLIIIVKGKTATLMTWVYASWK